MKFRKTAGYRLMSLLVIGTLTMTSFGMVQAKSTSTSYQEEAVSSKKTKAKISSRLMKQFQQEDKVTFLVKMKEQTNVKKVAKDAVSKAKKQKLTAAKTQYTKRSAVVSELRATSEETQEAVACLFTKGTKEKASEGYSFVLYCKWSRCDGNERSHGKGGFLPRSRSSVAK